MNIDATADEMNISFKPSPNYVALAEAAAGGGPGGYGQDGDQWLIGVRVDTVGALREVLHDASRRVITEQKGFIIEALIS